MHSDSLAFSVEAPGGGKMPQIPISRLEKLLLDLSIRIKMSFSGGNIHSQIRVPLTQQNSSYILFYP